MGLRMAQAGWAAAPPGAAAWKRTENSPRVRSGCKHKTEMGGREVK